MPKKKPALKLPDVHVARSTLVDTASLAFKENGRWQVPSVTVSSSTRSRFVEISGSRGLQLDSLELSAEETEHLSRLLEDTLHASSQHVRRAVESESVPEWDVSTPDAIISEVSGYLRRRRPGLGELDDSLLERKEAFVEDRLDRSCLVVLPDNRVRSMEDRLSRRMRAMLLNEEDERTIRTPTPPPRQKDDVRLPGRKKPRNPWYIKPADWFTGKAITDSEEKFPYDALADAQDDPPNQNEPLTNPDDPDAPPRRLTKFDCETPGRAKEICDAYRNELRGTKTKPPGRLPHFLQ